MSDLPEISVLLISFNTREVTRECLDSLYREAIGISMEVIAVDNASRDASAEMIATDYPEVILIRSDVNVGFGRANNLALERARGRYVVLLNTDAFFHAGSLRAAIQHMDAEPRCGLAGGRLMGSDGSAQPSARTFHSVSTDAFVLTGLAAKYPHSRVFGRMDRTWADPMQPAQVDWVPGAFSIIRPEALKQAGAFDPAFFLYYEEVDLCRRIKAAGWQIWYWPDVVVTHLGGESSRSVSEHAFSSTAAQVVLWRMRSTFLYYRKHHGLQAWLARGLETTLYALGEIRNRMGGSPERKARAENFTTMRRLLGQAWKDTKGGRMSPPQPW